MLIVTKSLLWLFAICIAVGAFDSFRGNKWGLGERFLAGIRAFEPLFLTMAGILVLVPLFQRILAPLLVPVCTWCGIDPAMIAGTFLANDMGAFPLAQALSRSPDAAGLSGMLVGSVLGVNIVFTLPAALKMVEKDDRKYLFKGMLYGFITLPAGCFLGGLTAGYAPVFLLIQLIPVLLAAIFAVLMLWLIPEQLTKILTVLGRGIEALALAGVVVAIFAELTGHTFPGYLDSIMEGVRVVGSIIIVLPGAYVFITLLDRFLHPVFLRLGRVLGINETAALGMVTSLANSIPTFLMIKDMDARGKVMNFAFLTGGAFVLGDHLAFCCAVAPELAFPLIVTKLTAAVTAVELFLLMDRKNPEKLVSAN